MFKKLFIIGLLLLSSIPQAFAQVLGKTEVKLTEPVGGDILPGGEILGAKDIKSSFVFSKLVPFVITYAIGLATALSVIALIIGGYQYLTAYGNEEQHKTAQKTITYAVIGLIVTATAYGLVKIITSIKFGS